MHRWGDEDFDWESLYHAIEEISSYFTKWRLGNHSKEKYGTARISIYFFNGSLFELCYPGYVSYWPWKNYSKLLKFDIYYVPIIFRFLGLTKLIRYFQYKVYSRGYNLAIKKYPHIKKEILICADYPELIKNYPEDFT